MKNYLLLSVLVVLGGSFSMTASAESRKGGEFGKIDSDGNGVITRQEHADFSSKRFDAADSNGDGEISKEEMKSQFQAKKDKREMRRERKERKE